MHHNILCAFAVILLCCSAATATLVPAVCVAISHSSQKNVSYEFCIRTLESDPRSSKAGAEQLAVISFTASITKANAISSIIDKLLTGFKINRLTTTDALKICLNFYSRIAEDLQAGIMAIKDQEFDTANARVYAAIDKASGCENEIKTYTRDATPLKEEISEFYQLSAINLGFTKLLPIIN